MSKFENYTEIDSLGLLLKEIENNIQNKNFYVAMYLSLSIPDILGLCEHPEFKDKTQERYVLWFDENVRDFFGFLPHDSFYGEDGSFMNGKVCYQIRCKVFHQGTNDIFDKTGIDEFVFSMGDDDFVHGMTFGTDYDLSTYDQTTNAVSSNSYLYVSCKEFATNMLKAAKAFISSHPNLSYPKIKINQCGGKAILF